jgi:hypothetical protein
MTLKTAKGIIIFGAISFLLLLAAMTIPYLIWDSDTAMGVMQSSAGLALILIGITGYNLRRFISIDRSAKNLPILAGMMIYNVFFGLSFAAAGITRLTHQSADIQFLPTIFMMCLGCFAGVGAYLIKRRQLATSQPMHRSEQLAIVGILLLGLGIFVLSLIVINTEGLNCLVCPAVLLPAFVCLLLAGIFRLNKNSERIIVVGVVIAIIAIAIIAYLLFGVILSLIFLTAPQ